MSLSVKNNLWLVMVLLAVAAAYGLVSGDVRRWVRFFVSDASPQLVITSQNVPSAGKPPEAGNSGKNNGSADSHNGFTRTYFKPSHSKPVEAVRLEISAAEHHGELLIAGKLFDGSVCNRLQIDLALENDDGRKIFHTLILGRTGQAGARSIRSKRRLPPSSSRSPTAWRAHVAALRCLDP